MSNIHCLQDLSIYHVEQIVYEINIWAILVYKCNVNDYGACFK